jgi:uncharacterized protein (DUF1778 family)
MVTKSSNKSAKTKPKPKAGWAEFRPRFDFRFSSHEHFDMVRRAAEHCGLSINAWMVQVSLKAARGTIKDMEK